MSIQIRLVYVNHFFKIIGITIPLLLSIALLTLTERKVMGSMQRRKGPNVVSLFNVLEWIREKLKRLSLFYFVSQI